MIDVDATIEAIWNAAQLKTVPTLDGSIFMLEHQLLQVCYVLSLAWSIIPWVLYHQDQRKEEFQLHLLVKLIYSLGNIST